MYRYQTLIADDEAPARQRLRKILEEFDEIDVVGEAVHGLDTLEKINMLKPDLLFLDIQMPGLTGFEVLNQAGHFPVVIFCTAYDHYAMEAFDTLAVDFIVKPVKSDRLRKSIEKLSFLRENLNRENILDTLKIYLNLANGKKQAVSVPVKLGDRILLVKLTDICYFQADEKYVTIVTRDGKRHLIDFSLKYLETRIGDQFIRIHRSLLVNRNMIREINRYFGNRVVIRMDDFDQSKLISGRNYSDNIRLLTEL
jgi:two-component system LytT family response regulator